MPDRIRGGLAWIKFTKKDKAVTFPYFMHYDVVNAPAFFHELMNKILCILQRRHLVQELVSCGRDMEAHIGDVSLGTNDQGDHILLPPELFRQAISPLNSRNVNSCMRGPNI